MRKCKINRVAEVIDFKKLVSVLAVSDKRDLVSFLDPVVKDLENAEAVCSDEGFRPDRRNVESFFALFIADPFKCDLAFAVVADTFKFVRFKKRMMIRNAVNSS